MNYQNNSNDDDLDLLLEKFIQSKSCQGLDELELRNKLASANIPILERTVNKNIANLPKCISSDDCFQEGFIGLLKAVEKFNPEKNPNFQAWATHNIKFAILDYLRSNDEFSRKLRTFIKQYKKAEAKLETILYRSPTEEELLAELNIKPSEYKKYKMYVSTVQTLSLNEMLGNGDNDDGFSRLDTEIDKNLNDPEYSILEKEIVFDSFHKLSFNEKIILSLLYVERLKQKQISEILGLSEGRVSQIINELITKLMD